MTEEGFNDLEINKRRVSGFSAIYNLLQHAPSDCENDALCYMDTILERLDSSLRHQGVLEIKHEELQGFFLCALQ